MQDNKKPTAAKAAKAPAPVTYLSKIQLDDMIGSIKNRAAKLDAEIQKCALSALHHLDECGDIGYANRLYLALGKGHRKTALAMWLVAFGKLEVNMDAATNKEKPLVFAKSKETKLSEGAAVMWHDMKKEPDLTEIFDIQKALAQLLKRAANAQVNDPALLAKLQAVAA